MRQITVLHTCEIAGGNDSFVHGDISIHFRHWSETDFLPLLDGTIWACIDWEFHALSGLEVCRRLRCNPLAAQAHITMLLPADDQELRRSALRAGADDYIVGPVSRRMILDRILSNKLDGGANEATRTIAFGELIIDIASYQARWNGRAIALMPNEFRLLRYLIEHPDRVFTRSQLIAALGKHEEPLDERTVDVWIGRLRRALRAAGAPGMVRTVRSLGYVLDKP